MVYQLCQAGWPGTVEGMAEVNTVGCPRPTTRDPVHWDLNCIKGTSQMLPETASVDIVAASDSQITQNSQWVAC